MFKQEMWQTFINRISEDYDAVYHLDGIINDIAEEYSIARIDVHFTLTPSPYNQFAKDEMIQAFDSGKEADDVSLEYEYVTDDRGVFHVTQRHVKGGIDWDEQIKGELKTLFDIVVLGVGRARLINSVRHNAFYDVATGIYNVNGFIRFGRELHAQNIACEYNAYYFNLKSFGLINRRFGNRATDDVLVRYAKKLQEFVNEDECVGRLGGDNFVAFIKRERTKAFLSYIASVKTYASLEGEDMPIEVASTCGVYEIDEDLDNIELVLTKCAIALNVAKNIAKKPYVFLTPEINNKMLKQKQILMRFPSAIQNQEFRVYYQPKVETDSYSITGAEALVRWAIGDEIIPPMDFVPLLENDGGISALDFYVLERVCKDIKNWMAHGIEPVRISVNFSRVHLSDPNFAEKITDIIEKYEIPYEYIEIEITETTDEKEQNWLIDFMKKMNEQHITTAIDDFGTGYSSLNILRHLPVDVLKLDKSFVDGEEITENDRVVLSNIIRMARELNMNVVAEGVERWDQVELLHDMDCNVVQGFLFDRPMFEERFKSRLKMKKYDITQVQDV